ncbi:MAG: pantetheine-phosphate adenylyltransferase, partial [Patescibacteria group bacterium]
MKRYKHLTVGGTFDHFHKGHKKLLDVAFMKGETVWLGITSSKYISTHDTKSANSEKAFENYLYRETSVVDFLKKKDLLGRVKIISIDDKFGTALTDAQLQAIVVSSETELVATEINLLRAQNNWPALEIIVVPWVMADDGVPINSIRIRSGEIDRNGKVYRLPKEWGVRKLPDDLRIELQKPFGRLISDLSYLGDLGDLKTQL